MSEANPYQPPRTELADLREQKFARRLLSLRHKPLTLGTFYRLQARFYLILVVYVGAAIGFFVWVGFQPLVYVFLGFLAGTLLRDFGIARMQKKAWPMQHKVLDWLKVEKMAAGDILDA